MVIHGYTMLALGLTLLYVRGTMTNLFFDVFGGAIAMLLVAASLLFIASLDWILAAGLGRRKLRSLRGLLAVSTAVAVCGVLLILYPGTTVQMWCYLIAIYAFALSIAKASLARSWNGSKREQLAMYVLAGITFAFSGCLAAVARHDERSCLEVVAGYSVFMGLQMLLTIYFLQNQKPRSGQLPLAMGGWLAKRGFTDE
jgi:hypothetical protein